MPQILDGKIVRDEIATGLSKEIAELARKPSLAIIQIGDRADSDAYVRQKKLFSEKIGVNVIHLEFKDSDSEDKILRKIDELNANDKIHGIIIQLPLPQAFDKKRLINAIDPVKDVDGLGRGEYIPATAKGVVSLLDYYKISVVGKKVAVIGRSELVGKPIAEILEKMGGKVTVCHSQTKNIPEITKNSDIVVVAIGRPKFIGAEYFTGKQIVVDVGINSTTGEKLEEEIGKRKIVGDVDFEAVKDVVSAISPVPGGVGPMTVASLFENLLGAYQKAL